jgi:hypothetical protein
MIADAWQHQAIPSCSFIMEQTTLKWQAGWQIALIDWWCRASIEQIFARVKGEFALKL